MALALRCGVNVAEMQYRDALGQDVAPLRGYKVGQYWVSMFRDGVVARDLVRNGELTWGAWARSWMGATFDVFSIGDPLPAIWDARQRLRRRQQRRPAPQAASVLEGANRL